MAGRIVGAGACAVMACLLVQAPARAGQEDRAALYVELQALEARLDRLTARRRRPAPAAALEAGARPRSWKLPGSNTSMAIGGYVKLDLIYNVNAPTLSSSGDDSSSVADAPPDGSAAANRQGNFRLHARQSRIWIRTWTPTDYGTLETRIEGDFYGTGGNQLISNSTAFRLRHAVGRLGPLLAGQTWSNLFQGYGSAQTVERGGPGGKYSVRQGQIRYTHLLGRATRFAISVENPEVGSATGPGAEIVPTGGIPATGVVGSTLGANDPMPIVALQLNRRYSGGAFGVVAGFRQLHIDDGAGISASALGWITQIAGNFAITDKLRIGGNAYVGEGFGRGVSHWDTSAILTGANGATARLRPVLAVGGIVWARYQWTPALRSNLVYTRSRVELVRAAGSKAALAGTTGLNQDLWQLHANLLWNPAPRVEFGIEYAYGFRGAINSANGKINRIQASMRFWF